MKYADKFCRLQAISIEECQVGRIMDEGLSTAHERKQIRNKIRIRNSYDVYQ